MPKSYSEYVARADDGAIDIEGALRIHDGPGIIGDLVADFGDGMLCVLTGINRGPVTLSVQALLSNPGPATDLDPWDDICEVSVEAGESGLSGLIVVGGEDPRPERDIRLDRDGPGWYRLRVSARGRSSHYDQVVYEPVESYMIEAWRQEPTANVVTKMRPRQG